MSIDADADAIDGVNPIKDEAAGATGLVRFDLCVDEIVDEVSRETIATFGA